MKRLVLLVATLPLAACADEPVAPAPFGPLAAVAAAPQDLGTLGGGSQAFGISANGTVVGQYDIGSGVYGAFIWTQKAGMVPLPPPATSTTDWAWAVNDAKQVVGYSIIPGVGQRAILWTKNVPYDLGTLAGGDGAADARGINRFGHVAGLSSRAGGGYHAMLWMPAAPNGTTGTMYDLGSLGDGDSRANALNDAGQVVGAVATGGGVHAFLWMPDVQNGTTGTMIDLTPGAVSAEAYGINDRGEVVGQVEAPAGVLRAFRWTAAEGLQVLGTFAGGSNSFASGIDRLGRIFGGALPAAGPFRPFVWTAKNGFEDLGTVGGSTGQAFAANPKGQAVGWSTTSGGAVRATLWVLP